MNIFKRIYYKIFKPKLLKDKTHYAKVFKDVHDIRTMTDTRVPNPYTLYWLRADWTNKELKDNNTKYWQWEIDNNNFKP